MHPRRETPPGESRNRAVRALIMCAAAAMFEGFDNQAMGVAAPMVFREYSIAPSQGGLIFSAATLGLALGAAIGGRLADHLGRRQTLTLSLLMFGIFSLLTAWAQTTQMLLVARLLTGLGCGGAMPAFIAMASEAVEPRRRLSAVTLVMAALPLGGALAGAMALGARLGWGWRSIFVAGGIAPILAGLTVPIALHRESRNAATTSSAKVESAPGADSRTPVRVGAILWGAQSARTTLLLWSGFFFTQLILFLMLNWLPSLIVGLGFTRTEASLASIGFNLAGSVGALSLGRLHAGARRRLWVTLTYGGIAAALSGLAVVSSHGKSFAVLILASSTAGIFIIGAQLILYALAPLYYSSNSRGTGVGAAVAVGRLGSVAGPLLAAIVLAAGSSSATVLTAIIPFVLIAGATALALTWQAQSGD